MSSVSKNGSAIIAKPRPARAVDRRRSAIRKSSIIRFSQPPTASDFYSAIMIRRRKNTEIPPGQSCASSPFREATANRRFRARAISRSRKLRKAPPPAPFPRAACPLDCRTDELRKRPCQHEGIQGRRPRHRFWFSCAEEWEDVACACGGGDLLVEDENALENFHARHEE